MPIMPRVIVLGLGVAGSSIVEALSRQGFRVTGIEQFAPLHERGSSHGDTRIFRRVPHEGPVYVEMATASYQGWRAWSRIAKENLFVECGGIDAGPVESRLVHAAEELCRQYDQTFEVFDGRAFNLQHNHFNLPKDWRVVYQPSSGWVRPDATRVFLHELAREHGARFLYDTKVLGIDFQKDSVQVRTSDETLTCDFLVVSAGSWLPKLFPELGSDLSTERRVLGWFQPRTPEELWDGRFPIFCLDADGGWYGMPTPDGRVKIGHDKHFRQKIDPDDLPIPPGVEDAAKLSKCVRKYLSGFAEQPGEMKPCIYTLTEDHHFIIDRHPQHTNVLVFSCCSGHGFKYAPVYGEIAADLIEGNPRAELDLFHFNRTAGAAMRFSDS